MKSVIVIIAILHLLFQDPWSLQTGLASQLAWKDSFCSLTISEKPHFSVPQQILYTIMDLSSIWEREYIGVECSGKPGACHRLNQVDGQQSWVAYCPCNQFSIPNFSGKTSVCYFSPGVRDRYIFSREKTCQHSWLFQLQCLCEEACRRVGRVKPC